MITRFARLPLSQPKPTWRCRLFGHRLGNLDGARDGRVSHAVPLYRPDGTLDPAMTMTVERCTFCGRKFYGAECGWFRRHSWWG